MKISGSYVLPLTVENAYRTLQNPDVLAKCMPGCEKLERIGEDEYAMKMKMALAAVSGLFEGKIRITDSNPPTSFKLIVEGAGKIGFMKGEGDISLVPLNESSTTVSYEGDVQVGGTIAAIGNRLVESTSKMMIKRFFDKLVETASA